LSNKAKVRSSGVWRTTWMRPASIAMATTAATPRRVLRPTPGATLAKTSASPKMGEKRVSTERSSVITPTPDRGSPPFGAKRAEPEPDPGDYECARRQQESEQGRGHPARQN